MKPMIVSIVRAALLAGASLVSGIDAFGTDAWPGFRGSGDGHVRSGTPPLSWELRGRASGQWTIRLPGYGQSSPVVHGDRIFVTAVSGPEKENLHVLAVARDDGCVLWQRDFVGTQRVEDRDSVSRGAPTPVVDADRVYAVFESGDAVALTRDGEIHWRRSFVADYGEIQGPHGYASSPLLVDHRLLVQVSHSGPSYVLALDASTGENLWKVDHPSQTGWSSPALFQAEGRRGIIVSTSGSVRALDPETGRQLWVFDDLQGNSTASPTIHGNWIVIGCGGDRGGESGSRTQGREAGASRGRSAGEKVGEPGSVAILWDGDEPPRIVWREPRVTVGYASPVVSGELAYFVNRVGGVQCVELATGKPRSQHRLPGQVWASPIVVGEHVVFFTRDGSVTAVPARDSFEDIAESSISATDIVYGVAVAGDSWIVRTGRGMSRIVAPATESAR